MTLNQNAVLKIFEAEGAFMNVPNQEIQLPQIDSQPYVRVLYKDNSGKTQDTGWVDWPLEHVHYYDGSVVTPPGGYPLNISQRSVGAYIEFAPGAVAQVIGIPFLSIISVKFGAVPPGPAQQEEFLMVSEPKLEEPKFNISEHFHDPVELNERNIVEFANHQVTHNSPAKEIMLPPAADQACYMQIRYHEGNAKLETDWMRCKFVYYVKATGCYTCEFKPSDVLEMLGVQKTARKISIVLAYVKEEEKPQFGHARAR